MYFRLTLVYICDNITKYEEILTLKVNIINIIRYENKS